MPSLIIAGVDEAGRGPLAGPVVAAAVVLDARCRIVGLADSKTLGAARREALFRRIMADAAAAAFAIASVEEIDRLNILQASLLAMKRAVAGLAVSPDRVLIDGRHCPDVTCAAEAVVRGDQSIGAISAASIVAKVMRDAIMRDLDSRYPGYGFSRHKGYPTAAHLEALGRLGPCAVHRRSFAPVRRLLGANPDADV